MPEVRDHLFDGVFHAVELGKSGVDLDDLVGEKPGQALVVARVDGLRLTNGLEHALGGSGVSHGVALALVEVVLEREFFFARALVASLQMADDVHADLLWFKEAPNKPSPVGLASGEVLMKPLKAPSELS